MMWKKVSWEEVLTIKNGRSQKKVSDRNGKYPIYGSGGIMGYANDYLCDEGTTIIGRKGSINNPIYVDEKFWNVDTAFGLCPGEKLDNKFLYYFCTTYNFLKHNKATTLPSLTKADLLKITIPLPPLETQKKIAAILDEADKLRQLNRQLIEKYDALTQSLFLEMFGDPVMNPKGWEKIPGSNYYEVKGRVGRKGYKKTDLRSSGPLVLGATHINQSGFIDLSKPVYLTEEKYLESPEIMVVKRDLIFVQRGNTIGKIGLVHKDIGRATINPVVLILRPIESNPFFLLHLLMNKSVNQRIIELNSGSAQPMITQKSMNEYKLIDVPLKLQDKFAERVQAIEQQKAQTQASLKKSEELFNSLLQRAFKGELV